MPLLCLAALLAGSETCRAASPPVVFWASDPIGPGQMAVVRGEGLGDHPTVELARLSDDAAAMPNAGPFQWLGKGQTLDVVQPNDRSVKFVVPSDMKPGIFAYRITGPAGAAAGRLNRPTIWWAQGNLGLKATPGGWVRLFGKNLKAGNGDVGAKTTVVLQGRQTVTLAAEEADCYAVSIAVPKDLPVGEYKAFVHTGAGGSAGWSESVKVQVANAPTWPQTVFNVRDFGAQGDGGADATPAVEAALKKAEENGGGIVYFPRGRYKLNATLNIPANTVLRGERTDLTQLFWGDGRDGWRRTPTDRFPCVIRGTHDFGIEDIMLWFVNADNGIVADQDGQAAGNVFLRRVRMQWLLYAGYITIEQANEIFKRTATDGGAGAKGALLRLGGQNVEITECDLESSGSVLWLCNARGACVTKNRFRIGRLGYCFVHGGERLIFENNAFAGADNMARSAMFFSSHLRAPVVSRVYFAHNRLSNIWGWDRECMSTDGASGQYFGSLASATPTVLTLPAAQSWKPSQLAGHTLYIVGGRGKGQFRRVKDNTETTVTVEQPFDVPPDSTSTVGINHTMDRFLVIDNDYENVRIAFQFYGTGMESIVAHNRAARSGGFWSHASHYAGPPAKGAQPQFYIQYLDNHITEGNHVHAAPSGYQYGGGDSAIGVGAHPSTNADGSQWRHPMAIGFVIRGNRLDSNARIRVIASQNVAEPLLEDAVVEGNHIARSDWGIDVSAKCERVALRNNTFDNVRRPLSGDGLAAACVHPAALLAAQLETVRTLASEKAGSKPPAWEEVEAELERLKQRTAEDRELQKDCRKLFFRAWQKLARWPSARYSMELLDVLCGLKVQDSGWQKSTLHRLLHAGTGGAGEWPIVVSLAETSPALQLAVTPRWPKGWQPSAPTHTAQLKPGEQAAMPLKVTVPPGVWGPYSVPLALRFSAEGLPPGDAETVLTVGAGVVLDFAVIGPFPNTEGKPLDDAIHPPESRLDLNAEPAGIGGKVRWELLRTRGVDFAKRYKPKSPATAYALTCLRATEDVRASVLISCAGGLRVFLNRDDVPAFEGRPGTTQLNLKAGDNVLLLKLSSTAAGKWRLHYVNVDEIGPRVGGRIRPVPIAELRKVPVLTPPPLPPAKDAGPLRHTQGVAWRLVYADTFDKGGLASHWRQASGMWKTTNGVLVGRGPRAFLCFAQKLSPPIRIEYDARSKNPGDMSAFWLDEPPDYRTGYLIGFASNDNKLNKVLIDGEQVAESETCLAAPGKWHHVIAQILPDGRVQLIVDDHLALDAKARRLSPRQRFPGLWTWGAAEFDNVKVLAGGL